MNLKQLLSLINNMYNTSTKEINLNSATIGQTSITELFHTIINSNILSITNVTEHIRPQIIDNYIFFGGEVLLFNQSFQSEFKLEIEESNIILIITLWLSKDWKFKSSFNYLDMSIFDTIALNPAYIKDDTNKKELPALLLCSANYNDVTRQITLKNGINFYGYFNTNKGVFKQLNKMLSLSSSKPSYGNITYKNNNNKRIPLINIHINTVQINLFPKHKLTLYIDLVTETIDKNSIRPLISAIKITSKLSISEKEVFFYSYINNELMGIIDLTSNSLIPLPNKNELNKYIGNSSFLNLIPKELIDLSSINVSEIRFGLNITSLALEFSKLTLCPKTKELVIIPNIIEIQEPQLHLELFNLFNSNRTKMFFRLTGDLIIGNATFDAIYNLEGTQIHFQLSDGEEIDINNVFTHFFNQDFYFTSAKISEMGITVSNFPNDTSYTFNAIVSDVVKLNFGNINFELESISLNFSHNKNGYSGNIRSILIICNIPFVLNGNYPGPQKNIIFESKLDENYVIKASELISLFWGPLENPFFSDDLSVTKMGISITIPPKGSAHKKIYSFDGQLDFKFRMGNININEIATIHFENGNTENDSQSYITCSTLIENINAQVDITYDFKKHNELSVYWAGFRGIYNFTNKIITFSIEKWTLGELIKELYKLVDSSSNFSLKEPWNILNHISLDNFIIIFNMDKKQINFKYSLPSPLHLGFISLDGLSINKEDNSMKIGIEGSFLGKKIEDDDPLGQNNMQDINNMPSVPGLGNDYFRLYYLGLGQHIALSPTKTLNSIEEATKSLMHVFKQPERPKKTLPILPISSSKSPSQSSLIYNENSNWLIGTKMKIIDTIDISIIFNDPNLYGLLIELSGPKSKTFNGLKFEIMYKKVTDNIGVYQTELKLPDTMRYMEFGSISVTLPVVALQIYTNGNFMIDVGFPKNLDFSRSVTIEAFPYVGSGGFYFGKLSSNTSSNVPKTPNGKFNPVIAFGLGLQLGFGKDIHKGLLTAGLSLTAIGIFEGILGFYIPNNKNYPGEGDHYYKVQGTFGIVGHLYGKVEFAIVSARVDIMIYTTITTSIESYNSIPIDIEAKVKISLKVSIHAGLFKIHIHYKFSSKISASFVIGKDTRQSAPWNIDPSAKYNILNDINYNPIKMNFKPLLIENEQKQLINLYFIPHLTLGSDSNGYNTPKYIGMLYIESLSKDTNKPSSFDHLVIGLFIWIINSYINTSKDNISYNDLLNKNINISDLKNIYLNFIKNNNGVFTKQQIMDFLYSYFKINIISPNHSQNYLGQNEINGTVFPMIPDFKLISTLNDKVITEVDFNTNTPCSKEFLQEIQKLFSTMDVNYKHCLEKKLSKIELNKNDTYNYSAIDNFSMSTIVFTDYFMMIARFIIEEAIDIFSSYTYNFKGKNLADIYKEYGNQLIIEKVLKINKDLLLNCGLVIQIPDIKYVIKANDNLQDILNLYPPLEINDLNITGIIDVTGLIEEGTKINIKNYKPYIVKQNDSIITISNNLIPLKQDIKISTLQILQSLKDARFLKPLVEVTLPIVLYKTKENDTLLNITTRYNVSFKSIASNIHNCQIIDLYKEANISLPQLVILPLKKIICQIYNRNNLSKIAGMISRFLLHGLRLPNNKSEDKYNTSPLYELIGQQIDIPDLHQNDKYSIMLINENNNWCSLNNRNDSQTLQVDIDNHEISRINALKSLNINFDSYILQLKPLPVAKLLPITIPVNSYTPFYYPGSLNLSIGTQIPQITPTITMWQLSSLSMNTCLWENGSSIDVNIKTNNTTQTKNLSNYSWSTLISIQIHKLQKNKSKYLCNTYEVIGADEQGIIYLEKLLQQTQSDSIIDNIRLLYEPSLINETSKGLTSQLDNEYNMGLIQCNISTDTHPIEKLPRISKPINNTINTPIDFLSLLWKCSVTRSGGYYLYYNASESGDGLPNNIFNENGIGNINILVTYKNKKLTSYANYIITSDPINNSTTLSIEAPSIQTKSSILQPGNIGFELIRTSPKDYNPIIPYPIPSTKESIVQDMIYLNEHYNLLGYKLESNKYLKATPEVLIPISPQTEQYNNNDSWYYTKIIPTYKFANDKICNNELAYPSIENNPYASMGGFAEIGLSFRDIFGNKINNTISQQNLTIDINYTDNLISLNSLPNIVSYYYFRIVNEESTLFVEFDFDTSKYANINNSKVINQAKLDAIIYSKLYYQIIQDDVKLYLSTTINNSKEYKKGVPYNLNKEELLNYIGNIYKYLMSISDRKNNDNILKTKNYIISTSVELSNSQNIFPLIVTITTERTAHIHPDFQEVSNVKKSINKIEPLKKKENNSLTTFGENFETTFNTNSTRTLKLAIGMNKDDSQNKHLWVVQFDKNGENGISICISKNNTNFYAPIPLENSLQTYDNIPITPYITGQDFILGQNASFESFKNIDLDKWGKVFLNAIDDFLSSEYAVPAYLLDNGKTLNEILDSKYQLAEAITGTIDKILNNKTDNCEGIIHAREKFKQQLLIKLSNAYSINTIVQNNIEIKSQFTGSNILDKKPYVPKLYGKMCGNNAKPIISKYASIIDTASLSQGYTLSTSKIALGNGQSFITYCFCADEAQKHSSFMFEQMKINISHIEFNINEITGMDGYKSSSWLRFILPLEKEFEDVGSVEIPIPLREYPVPPSILSQEAIYNNYNLEQEITINNARKWIYSYCYQKSEISQDEIYTQVQFNVPTHAKTKKSLLAENNLPKALAEFISQYEKIKSDFRKYLTKINLNTIQADTQTYDKAISCVKAFNTLVNNVTIEWGKWNQHGSKDTVSLNQKVKTLNYRIYNEAYSKKGYKKPLYLQKVQGIETDSMPLVKINDYKSEQISNGNYLFYNKDKDGSKNYLTYKEGVLIKSRNINFKLDILNYQNAWAGIYLTRNNNLVSSYPTNSNFIYSTPIVRFYEILTPLLQCNSTIKLESINHKVLELETHLHNLFNELLKDNQNENVILKLECLYSYSLTNTYKSPTIQLPIVLVPPKSINILPSNEFISDLANNILSWFFNNQPIKTNGTILFKVEIYSNDNTMLPIIKFENIKLKITSISNLAL
jgi:hypothetical protein